MTYVPGSEWSEYVVRLSTGLLMVMPASDLSTLLHVYTVLERTYHILPFIEILGSWGVIVTLNVKCGKRVVPCSLVGTRLQ